MKLPDAIQTLIEAADALVTDGGAGEERVAKIDEATALLQGLAKRDRSLLNMTPEEAGVWLLYFAAEFERANKALFKDPEFEIGMRSTCVLTLAQQVFEMHAGHAALTVRDVEFHGVAAGDWRVTIERLDEDGLPVQVEGETISRSLPMPERRGDEPPGQMC